MEQISKDFGRQQVRQMASQFADLYFTFVSKLRDFLGEDETLHIVTKVLFQRAKERAKDMIRIAEQEHIARIPDNIGRVSNVPYLGWDASLGCDHCPYGAAWKKRIKEHPWFQIYAKLYCDVTDTTIAEIFTGKYSHKLTENVVLGDMQCERIYYQSDAVEQGNYTYEII